MAADSGLEPKLSKLLETLNDKLYQYDIELSSSRPYYQSTYARVCLGSLVSPKADAAEDGQIEGGRFKIPGGEFAAAFWNYDATFLEIKLA